MVQVEVFGHEACFTRPEEKGERVSYDVITPSAARGILESVYWHNGLRYVIDRIFVLSPIRFMSVRRNEVKEKILASSAMAAYNGTNKTPWIVTSESINQRASLMLRDVHYILEAHFDMTDRANPSDNPGKFQDIIKRRLRKGQYYAQPYLGCRECTAHVRLWEDGEIPAIPETRDLGLMLYDMDYADPRNIRPMFFRAQLVNGVIDLRNCEVIR